jgi:purine-nucleoside phosphorylase
VKNTTTAPVIEALIRRFGAPPQTAVVLGSGLGGLARRLEDPQTADYKSLGLPEPSVAGHAGTLAVGRLGQARVAFLSGRVHLYEGRPTDEVVLAVRCMAHWGVERIILTNAAGGVDPSFQAGDVMLMTDHLNLTGRNPLVGTDTERWGPRFPDMGRAYDPDLRAQALALAGELGIALHQGVYAAMIGPSYETPAEVRMLAVLGARAVGMSTVPEAIALAQLGLPVLGFSMISNQGAGIGDAPLDHAEVSEAAAKAGVSLGQLIQALVERWG